jgi:hypothetical protein
MPLNNVCKSANGMLGASAVSRNNGKSYALGTRVHDDDHVMPAATAITGCSIARETNVRSRRSERRETMTHSMDMHKRADRTNKTHHEAAPARPTRWTTSQTGRSCQPRPLVHPSRTERPAPSNIIPPCKHVNSHDATTTPRPRECTVAELIRTTGRRLGKEDATSSRSRARAMSPREDRSSPKPPNAYTRGNESNEPVGNTRHKTTISNTPFAAGDYECMESGHPSALQLRGRNHLR